VPRRPNYFNYWISTIHRALLYSCLHAHPVARARAPEAMIKEPNRSSSTSPSLNGDSPVASPALPSAASMNETANQPPPNDRFPSPTPHLPASPAISLLACSVSAGVGTGGPRGGRHCRGGGGTARDGGRQAREQLLDCGARWGAHLLGLHGGGGPAQGPRRPPRPLHGKLKLFFFQFRCLMACAELCVDFFSLNLR
jgi:hypothetical protein